MGQPVWRHRVAEDTDLPVLAELERQLFGRDAWSEPMLADELARMSESRRVVVMTASGAAEPVAYAILRVTGDLGEIQRVGVAPDRRRRGLAKALLSELLAEARLRRCAEVLLEVGASNTAAIELYAGFGFAAVARRPGYYAGGEEDALVMRLDLH